MNQDNRENMGMIPMENQETALAASVKQILTLAFDNLAKQTESIAASQALLSDRMTAIEKQMRMNLLVTPKQVRYLNDAIRMKARELLQKRDADGNKKASMYLANAIRKAVLMRYGVASLYEIPRHEYQVAMTQIGTWNDSLCVRDAVKRAQSADE